MKKIVLAFAFLPMLSFAQDVNESPHKGIFDSSVIKESNDPALFVNGERVDKTVLLKIDTSTIDKIKVIKDDPNYKYGKIMIALKSKNNLK